MTGSSHINVLGVCGSLRAESHTRRALEIALRSAQHAGADTAALAGDALRLPLCDGSVPDMHDMVVQLQAHVRRADALLLATPEYCGTLSAVMKNVVEWLSPDLLKSKVVGVLAVAEGMSAHGALAGLHQLCWAQGAWVLPFGVAVPLAHDVFRHPTRTFAQQYIQHLEHLGVAVLRAAQQFRHEVHTP